AKPIIGLGKLLFLSLLPLAMYWGSLFILQKQYYIFVACTRGNKSYIKEWLKKNRKEVYASIHETSLRGCVEHVLLQNDIKFVSVGHPCSWYKSSCRKPRKLKMLKKLRSVK
ncbi:MAG: hypothetical protein M0P13_11115, partial [Fibrobacteraceae bacterium]|nr:hypothetical protein [Fibrobacteraceae bacterium]